MRAHAAPDGTVAILFSDIEDSTILTERLGDERWLEVLREAYPEGTASRGAAGDWREIAAASLVPAPLTLRVNRRSTTVDGALTRLDEQSVVDDAPTEREHRANLQDTYRLVSTTLTSLGLHEVAQSLLVRARVIASDDGDLLASARCEHEQIRVLAAWGLRLQRAGRDGSVHLDEAALRAGALAAGTTLMMLLMSSPALALNRDDGDDPGTGLSVIETLGLYVLLPIGLFVVIAGLVMVADKSHQKKDPTSSNVRTKADAKA